MLRYALSENEMRVKVVGIGSALRKDDSIGIRLVNELNMDGIEVAESSCDLSLLYALEECDTAIIVDAVDFGGKPGDTRIFEAKDLPKMPRSTHSMDLGFVLSLNAQLPKTFVFGVQPADMSFGDSLSEELSLALPKIKRELEEFIMSLR